MTTATKSRAASKSKKVTPKKDKVVEVNNQYGKGGKTAVIIKMVEAGKDRKQILDKLESLNPDIPRKTNAGLVSITLSKLGKRNIPSGVTNGSRKKNVKVSGSKK